ncbi:protein SUPPRESSOR OF GENE SILENCING 3-like [Salvia miltiorrhiza]|uniref:protein SUPPRESSOR OF GENE SILENCING 3-like n=1 Tax=Salvia miltiorrhiza TaxID=226208 RepID=UPI0025AD920B|nr:protein SUPPRESSOR OF GENE SILENCING 3-like [Salvia miltiorrhiza]XP_057777292.1 protein SUPPRESSOR OF GENE SILENCING 3-like [Salvia miltiorrhiza]
MNSRKGIGNPSGAVTSDPSVKGESKADVSNSSIDQLSRGVSDMNINPTNDDGWEEYGKKSKNKNKNNASRQLVPQHSTPKAWGHADTVQKLGFRTNGGLGQGSGRGYTRQQPSGRNPNSDYDAAPPVWNTRAASFQPSAQAADNQAFDEVDDDDESDGIDDSDDDLSDGFASDESHKSHETKKKNKWFKELFQCLDNLTVKEINEPERQWHCPACQGGPGAIDWYRGLQPLITHAKTKRSKRMKLHRELAEILDEELKRRGTSAVPAGEVFGKWKGLDERADKEIVWPPMVVIMNTKLDKDDNDRWIGMGNQELLDYFSDYSAIRARHSYGPQGHRGMSLLIFEASAVGYAEAERLSGHFEVHSRDRFAWNRNKVPFYPGGQRQLYGYMAEKHDMESFNQHSQGKAKLKYEMRSYQEVVVKQMKQMSDDNQQLTWFKNKVVKEQTSKKALEESFGKLSEKLRRTMQENQVVKLRTQKHHEQNKEEMDNQEQFYKDHIQQLYDARNAKEENFEKIQQLEREKATHSEANLSSAEERARRSEELSRFIQLQDQELEEFKSKRDKLMEAHEEQKLELKRKYRAEEMELEKKFDEDYNKLLGEYTPADSK